MGYTTGKYIRISNTDEFGYRDGSEACDFLNSVQNGCKLRPLTKAFFSTKPSSDPHDDRKKSYTEGTGLICQYTKRDGKNNRRSCGDCKLNSGRMIHITSAKKKRIRDAS